ncbi:transglycosylase, partial [Coemansia sp. S85]
MGLFKPATLLLAVSLIGTADSLAIEYPTAHQPGLGANYTGVARALNTAQNSFTCKSEYIDFSDPSALSKFNVAWCPQNAYQTSNSVVWRLTPDCGTTMIYPWDFQYGKLEARIRASPGSGVVSTILLAGPDPADELDWEWVGKDTWTAQSMYFVKGQR